MKKLAILSLSALVLTACSSEVAEVPETLDCIDGMLEYQVADTSMQFCYDSTWGDIVINETEGVTGSENVISFSGAGMSPVVKYQTNDFKKTPDDDGFCFNCLRVDGSEADLKADVAAQLGVENADELKVRKTDIDGVRGVRVNDGVNLIYYVPGAFDGHSLIIEADDGFAEELDEFIWHMIL